MPWRKTPAQTAANRTQVSITALSSDFACKVHTTKVTGNSNENPAGVSLEKADYHRRYT
jgi:hypothetical protein